MVLGGGKLRADLLDAQRTDEAGGFPPPKICHPRAMQT